MSLGRPAVTVTFSVLFSLAFLGTSVFRFGSTSASEVAARGAWASPGGGSSAAKTLVLVAPSQTSDKAENNFVMI